MIMLNIILGLYNGSIIQDMNVGTTGARQSTTSSIGTSPGLSPNCFCFSIFEQFIFGKDITTEIYSIFSFFRFAESRISELNSFII